MTNEYLKIAEQVGKHKTVQNLMRHINKETLYQQHKSQLKKKAAGVDGVTKAEYSWNLDTNLESLVERMKRFSYRPQPVKRVYIPKITSDKLRPLDLPSYEDKLVQGVMANILSAICEPKFLNLSYGFRPGRSCHQAVLDLDNKIMHEPVNYIVDADIHGFFDNVNHDWLIKFLEHDIEDKNFIRYIKKFLKSGIMEQGKLIESDKGTPQGGLISPILANVYLHYVLDLWFENVKLIGHYRYYGISDNHNKLRRLQNFCRRQLYVALNRRSQKKLTLEKYLKILEYNPIAEPKIYVSTWKGK